MIYIFHKDWFDDCDYLQLDGDKLSSVTGNKIIPIPERNMENILNFINGGFWKIITDEELPSYRLKLELAN